VTLWFTVNSVLKNNELKFGLLSVCLPEIQLFSDKRQSSRLVEQSYQCFDNMDAKVFRNHFGIELIIVH